MACVLAPLNGQERDAFNALCLIYPPYGKGSKRLENVGVRLAPPAPSRCGWGEVRRAQQNYHAALRASSKACSAQNVPASGPLLQRPSLSPGGLSQ